MSVVKSKRNQSKIEFENLYFTVADNVDNLVEHFFYVNATTINVNKTFITYRCSELEKLTDELLYHIKIANSIYPQCMMELEERRLAMDKAIGVCFAILTVYQRVMLRLRINDSKLVLTRMINSLKSWRKSNNKLKDALNNKS